MVDHASAHHEREHFFGAAKVVAGLTILSRLLGLGRDVAIWAFGATLRMDVFWTAFTVPNLLRRLFGEGALSAAFVPVFTEVAKTEGPDRARLVLANVAAWLALVLAALLALGELMLGVWLLVGVGSSDQQLLIHLLQILLPFMVTICVLALGSAALNCKGRFAYPAFAPIVLNVAMIAAVTVVHVRGLGDDWGGLFLVAGSVIVAGLVQVAGVWWLLSRAELTAVLRLRPVLAETRRIAALMLPMMIPLGLLQFSAFFDRFYALIMTATESAPTLSLFGWQVERPLREGAVTCLYAANRLYQFPLGVLAISLATAVFPLFSRYATANDMANLRGAANRALRLSLFMGVPAGAALWALAGPVADVICRHGQFTAENAGRVAAILQMYCLGMWAYFCNHILLRAFFAMKDTRTPLRISCVLAALNITLVVVLVATLRVGAAIGLATAITASLNTVILVAVLHRRLGQLGLANVGVSLMRTVVASVATAAGAAWSFRAVATWTDGLGKTWGLDRLGSAVALLTAVAAGVAVFLIAVRIMGMPELGELLRRGRNQPSDTAE